MDRGEERELCFENLLVRIHFITEMMYRTGLAPWEFEFPFPHVQRVLREIAISLPNNQRQQGRAAPRLVLVTVQWFRGGLIFEAHRLLYHSA